MPLGKFFTAPPPDDPREDFLRQVTAQVKGWDTRLLVREELRAHLDDQTQALEREGLPFPQAAAKAVETMGPPAEIGRQLAQVHRTRTPWALLGLAAGTLLLGLWVLFLLPPADGSQATLLRQLLGWPLSLAALLLAYRWGAFLLRRYPVPLLGTGLLLGTVVLLFSPGRINGAGSWALLYGQILCPFLPTAFALVMIRQEGTGRRGVLLCGLSWLASALYCLLLPKAAWGLAITLADLFLLTAAIARGWFGPGRKFQLGMVWVPAAAGSLGLALFLAGALPRRLEGWIFSQNRALWQQVGGALGREAFAARMSQLPGWRDEFLFTALANRLGWAGAAVLLAALAAFLCLLLWKSSQLPRPGDRLLSLSAAITLLIQLAFSLAHSLGLFPASLWFPFLAPGVRAAISSSALLGLGLSFFRQAQPAPGLSPLAE